MVRVKKTPINTMKMAVKLLMPKTTRARGTQAIGAIGAIKPKIGKINSSDHLERLINSPQKIDPIKAIAIPSRTRTKVTATD